MSNIEKLARFISEKENADSLSNTYMLLVKVGIDQVDERHRKLEVAVGNIPACFDKARFDKKNQLTF